MSIKSASVGRKLRASKRALGSLRSNEPPAELGVKNLPGDESQRTGEESRVTRRGFLRGVDDDGSDGQRDHRNESQEHE